MSYRGTCVALALLVLGASREVRAEEVPGASAKVSSTQLAVGFEGWFGAWPRAPKSPSAVLGYSLYGRYRVLPQLSVGGAFTRLLHTDVPCHDSFCVASATIIGATARYHGSGESTFDPWIQLAVGAAISEEVTVSNVGGRFYYPLDRVVVRPSFEAKAGLDYRFAFMAIGLDARMMGFGDPYHLYAGAGLHVEGRW